LGGGGYRWGRGNIINHPMKVYSTELDRQDNLDKIAKLLQNNKFSNPITY